MYDMFVFIFFIRFAILNKFELIIVVKIFNNVQLMLLGRQDFWRELIFRTNSVLRTLLVLVLSCPDTCFWHLNPVGRSWKSPTAHSFDARYPVRAAETLLSAFKHLFHVFGISSDSSRNRVRRQHPEQSISLFIIQREAVGFRSRRDRMTGHASRS